MGDFIPSGQRAVQRGTTSKFSLSQIFRELCALHAIRKARRATAIRLSKLFGQAPNLNSADILSAECAFAALERKYYALIKNTPIPLTL